MSTATYVRVARNDRCQLDTQTQRLHAYAAEHDLTITTTFYDVGRSTGRDRPGLSHMPAAARAGRFRLLVDRLDRVSRRAHDLAGVLDDLDHAAVALHCAGPAGTIMITRDALAVIHMIGATIHNNRPAADDLDDADHPTPAQTTRQENRR